MPPRYVLIANPGTKRCETYRRELAAVLGRPRGDAGGRTRPVGRGGPAGRQPGRPAGVRPAGRRPAGVAGQGRRRRPGCCSKPGPATTRPSRRATGGRCRCRRACSCGRGCCTAGSAGCSRPAPVVRRPPAPDADRLPAGRRRDVRQDGDVPAVARRRRTGPAWLENPADVFAELVADRARTGWPTAYLKLNTGSSATGIVVLRPAAEPSPLRRHHDRRRDRRPVLQLPPAASGRPAPTWTAVSGFLLGEGAFVQRGIPMAQIDGQNFDVRVVCVYGRPAASIFRLSSNPMTNLHLGGRRGDFARCRAADPDPRLARRPRPLRRRGRVLRLGHRRRGPGVRARVRPALRAGGERLRRLLPRLGGRPRPVGRSLEIEATAARFGGSM